MQDAPARHGGRPVAALDHPDVQIERIGMGDVQRVRDRVELGLSARSACIAA